jgi:hypothetical protein
VAADPAYPGRRTGGGPILALGALTVPAGLDAAVFALWLGPRLA